MLTGMGFARAHILIRYPISKSQTASVTLPDRVAPGLSWDFLKPPHEGVLDYGSPNGFLRNRALGGYLAQGWPSGPNPDSSAYFEFAIQPRETCVAQLESLSMAVLSTLYNSEQKTQALSPQHWEVHVSLSSHIGQTWIVLSEATPVEAGTPYTVHLFSELGNFSQLPPIDGGTTATVRIYGFDAIPQALDTSNTRLIHATGGLIHTFLNGQMTGLDLSLNGTIFCTKNTYNLLKSTNIANPILETLKLGNEAHLAFSTTSLTMIPESQITAWIVACTCMAAMALKEKRNSLKNKKLGK